MHTSATRGVLLARFAAFLLAASVAPQAAQDGAGFRQYESGFAGRFEDLLQRRLVLESSDERAFRGTLRLAREWTIDAEARGDEVVGTMVSGAESAEFSAAWRDDRLSVSAGSDQLFLTRTLDEIAALADLGPPVPDPGRVWTIAVYLGGDNNLEGNALLDLEEMSRGLPEKGVEVIALLDRRQDEEDTPQDWTEGRVLRVRRGQEAELLEALGEIDTGDPRTLASFVTGAFRAFPALHHAVVLWDHGGGWTGIVSDDMAPGSSTGENMLSLHDVRSALRSALLCSKALRLDLVAFDACLMAQLEVALAMSDLADFMVASEALVPGGGFPYETVLPLFAAADGSTRAIAAGIVRAFGESYDRAGKPGTTISALDLARMPGVARALDGVADACLPVLDEQWTVAARALYYGESYAPRAERSEKNACSLDLFDMLQRLRRGLRPFPAEAALAGLQRELASAVIASQVGERRRLSRGLAIYGPHRAAQVRSDYVMTPLGGGSGFARLVTRVHELAQAESTKPVVFWDLQVNGVAGRENVVQPCNAHTLGFTIEGDAIVAVEQWDFLRDGEEYFLLRKSWVPDPAWMRRVKEGVSDDVDLFMPLFVDGRNELSSELVGLQFMVANESTSVNATIDMTSPSSQAPIIAHARLLGYGEPRPLELQFDRASWLADVYELPSDQNKETRGLALDPDDELVFVIQTVRDDGTAGEILTQPIAWGAGLALVLTPDEPGDYLSAIVAETMDGRRFEQQLSYALEPNPDLDACIASFREWSPEALEGVWDRSLKTANEPWRDLDSPSRITGPTRRGPGVYEVESTFGPRDRRETLHQTWVIERRGLPSLRIIQPLEGGGNLVWYGPAAVGSAGEQRWISMKALGVGGVAWRWKRNNLASLLLPEDPAQEGGDR